MTNLYKLLAIVALCSFAVGAADKTVTPSDPTQKASTKPIDVSRWQVTDNTADSDDTLATTEAAVYGPYQLTTASNEPMVKGIGYHAKPITGTTPTVTVGYQLTASSALADTVSGAWTEFDTLDASGMLGYIDLSSQSARFMWVRIDNYDGTTSITNDYFWLMPKLNVTYERRH